MTRVRHFLLALLSLLPLIATQMKEDPTAYGIVQQMFAHTKQIESMSYRMKKTERIDGEMLVQKSFAKVTYEPYKAYTRQISPKEGLEALYIDGKHKNQALINTNGFPWINLRLDPYGKVMRKNQHHTILDAGYRHVVSILEFLFRKYGEETREMASLSESNWDGRACWKVVFNNHHYREDKRVFRQDETVRSWARKQKLSEYMLLALNSGLDHFEDSMKGETLTLPNDYCPKMVLVIEKERMVPLRMEVYDKKGLYELYEYSDIDLNPDFKDEEFSSDYEEYGF